MGQTNVRFNMDCEKEPQMPCVGCKGYKAEQHQFSCKPHECKLLNQWLKTHIPQLREDFIEMQIAVSETIPYVV